MSGNPPMDLHGACDEELMLAYALPACDHAGTALAHDAFKILYGRYRQPLYLFIRRMLLGWNESRTDDLFQETWARVCRSRHTFDAGTGRFKTWLFEIAKNVVRDLRAESMRKPSLSLEDVPDEGLSSPAWQPWPAPGAEDAAHWRRAGVRLLACLSALESLEQREAFLLFYQEGMSVQEIAGVQGVKVETAKSRLRYAHDALRACMEPYLGDLQ